MGTNYYARIIPTKERRDRLKELIDTNDFGKINDEIQATFGPYTMDGNTPTGGVVHLGKNSGGWKFLWNPNFHVIKNGHCVMVENGESTYAKYVEEPDTYHTAYPLTKKGIKDFIYRDDVRIYDEYGEEQDKGEFYDFSINKTDGLDIKSYYEQEGEEDNYHRYFDTPMVKSMRKCGYDIDAKYNSEFYSDGLRFATTNDFC